MVTTQSTGGANFTPAAPMVRKKYIRASKQGRRTLARLD
jgi:hypothetical protein